LIDAGSSTGSRGTTEARGEGLGLYIARTLVEKPGNLVELEDRVTGDYPKGANFTVVLLACGKPGK
jgi:nitrogen fixation/metabolism regulation signal transduction histidine kinase